MKGRNARRALAALVAISFIAIVVPNRASAMSNVAARLAITFLCADSDKPQIMIDVDGYFARRDNNWDAPMIGRMLKFQCYPALARDGNDEWVLVPYGATRAWVHRSAVRFKDGANIAQLPLVSELPPPDPAQVMRLLGVPNVSRKVKDLYKQAVKAGKNLGIVTVIGDCNSEHPVFFGRFGAGAFSLMPYPALQKTAQLFAPSFKRASLATSGSFSAAMAFDGTWADPKQCKSNEGPFACELRLSNASIAIISLGTGDTFTWGEFEQHYKQIIDYTLANKVVPVLMTKADDLETRQGGAPGDYINNVVRKLGAQYGLPVIDFALAAKNLPNGGLAEERNVDLQPIDPFHVNEMGMDARILMTLQTLSQIANVRK
jgi:hypothetical protein